jgi:hypothetical protein
MKVRTTTIALVTIGALIALAVGSTSAPAGNRDPESTMSTFPGLAGVTAGRTWAGTASLWNRESSTYTDVRFRLPIPTGAALVQTDCPQFEIVSGSPDELVCHWGHQLRSGETARVALALTVPGSGSTMQVSGTWVIKEGRQTKGGGPDNFPTNAVSVPLLSGTSGGQAGTFATNTCTNPSTPTLSTNQALSSGNPLATSVCAPNLPTVPITGIVAAINEFNATSGPGVTQVSDICLPAPGFGCNTTPFVFSPPATFTFRIDETSLPKVCSSGGHDDNDRYGLYHGKPKPPGGSCGPLKISKVYHDGVLVPAGSLDPKVVSIASSNKVTTVVVKASENGSWRFG